MKPFFQSVQRIGLLCLLSLATSLSPHSRADSGPPAPALAVSLSKPAWAVLNSLTRLLPIDTYAGPLGGPLALAGGRNEVVDGQLALFADSKAWQGIRVSFSNLAGPGGATIASARLRWRRIASVRTQQPGYQTRYVGLWPDPLLPAAPFDVAAHGRAFVWVDLVIPTDAKPGRYVGTLTLSATGTAMQTVPVSLRVWGWTMPHQSHIRTAFGIGPPGAHPLDEFSGQRCLAGPPAVSNPWR